ncbi:MAG: hypothetical protein K6E84_06075 [Lachnospiraceae bacterium]|nr:hypothetical protein [Lachnospiraceae bacterium]
MNEKRKQENLIRQGGSGSVMAWMELLVQLIFLIFLYHRIGMLGMSYFAVPYLIYRALHVILAHGSGRIIKRRVAFFRRRNAYRNAVSGYRSMAAAGLCVTLIIAAALFWKADALSMLMSASKLPGLGIRLFAVALVFSVLTSCMDGYLEGMGTGLPGCIARMSGYVSSLVLAFVLAGKVSSYSEKVAALMRTDHYYYAYMAALGSGSILIGNLIALLVLAFQKAAMTQSLRQLFDGGFKQKSDQTGGIGSYLLALLGGIFPDACPELLLLVLFAIALHGNTQEAYAGQFLAASVLLIRPVSLLATQITGVLSRYLAQYIKHSDLVHANERTAICLKVYTYILFPYLTALLAMAPSVGTAFFDTEDAAFASLLRFGIWGSLAFALFLFTNGIIGVLWERWAPGVMSLVAVLIAGVVQLRVTDNYWISMIAGCLVLFAIESVLLAMVTRFHQDLLRIFVLTGVSSVIFGLVSFAVQRVMGAAAGSWVTLILGLALGTLSYITCIVMTHTFDAYEWSQVPGKGLPLFIARWLRQY